MSKKVSTFALSLVAFGLLSSQALAQTAPIGGMGGMGGAGEQQRQQFRQEMLEKRKSAEMASHQERIRILNEANNCVGAAKTPEAYKACEQKEKNDRQANREKDHAAKQQFREQMQQRREQFQQQRAQQQAQRQAQHANGVNGVNGQTGMPAATKPVTAAPFGAGR